MSLLRPRTYGKMGLGVESPALLGGKVVELQMMLVTISCGKRFKVVRHVAGVASNAARADGIKVRW